MAGPFRLLGWILVASVLAVPGAGAGSIHPFALDSLIDRVPATEENPVAPAEGPAAPVDTAPLFAQDPRDTALATYATSPLGHAMREVTHTSNPTTTAASAPVAATFTSTYADATEASQPVVRPIVHTSTMVAKTLEPSCDEVSHGVQPARDALNWGTAAQNVCPLLTHDLHTTRARVGQGTFAASLSDAPATEALAGDALAAAPIGAAGLPTGAATSPQPGVSDAGVQAENAANALVQDSLIPGSLLGAALLGALAVALYRRILAREVLEQETRKRAYETVLQSPGITVGGVARELGLDYRVAAHHLRILQEFHFIEARQVGAWFRYYKNGGSYSDEAKLRCIALASPKARAVQEALATLPTGSLADLARATGLPKSTVKWHRDRLTEMGALSSA